MIRVNHPSAGPACSWARHRSSLPPIRGAIKTKLAVHFKEVYDWPNVGRAPPPFQLVAGKGGAETNFGYNSLITRSICL